jgi:hypothetical protein
MVPLLVLMVAIFMAVSVGFQGDRLRASAKNISVPVRKLVI